MMTIQAPQGHRTRNLLPVLAGVAVAVIILVALQQLMKGHLDDTVQWEDIVQSSRGKQVQGELVGLVAGIFIGSFVAGLFGSRPASSVFVSLLIIAIIVVAPWRFTLQKETIMLILPVWLLIGLGGFYSSRLLRKRR